MWTDYVANVEDEPILPDDFLILPESESGGGGGGGDNCPPECPMIEGVEGGPIVIGDGGGATTQTIIDCDIDDCAFYLNGGSAGSLFEPSFPKTIPFDPAFPVPRRR